MYVPYLWGFLDGVETACDGVRGRIADDAGLEISSTIGFCGL